MQIDEAAVKKFEKRLNELQDTLTQGNLTHTQVKELTRINKILTLYRDYTKLQAENKDLEQMMQDPTIDTDLKNLAVSDHNTLVQKIQDITTRLDILINPLDEDDENDTIIEIRAGAGGDEASLFAFDLYKMYSNYAQKKGFRIRTLDTSYSSLKGFKEVTFKIEGEGAYGIFKFESGVHRVQRIPVTESAGRIHTSTISVAILPDAKNIPTIVLNPQDLKIDVFRSSGPGGQSVNTTDSAVRVTHVPTRIVITCQDGKSQIQNREQAIDVLKSRLYAIEKRRAQEERGSLRRSQIGSGDRSEKIRTYNFQQDRVTDHRIKKTWHGIKNILEGDMDDIVSSLHEFSRHAT